MLITDLSKYFLLSVDFLSYSPLSPSYSSTYSAPSSSSSSSSAANTSKSYQNYQGSDPSNIQKPQINQNQNQNQKSNSNSPKRDKNVEKEKESFLLSRATNFLAQKSASIQNNIQNNIQIPFQSKSTAAPFSASLYTSHSPSPFKPETTSFPFSSPSSSTTSKTTSDTQVNNNIPATKEMNTPVKAKTHLGKKCEI